MQFTEAERAYLNEMRMLSTDNDGNEVFVGLTLEESLEHYKYTRLGFSHQGDMGILDRQVKLHEKHEGARLAVIGAEIAARDDKSPRH